MKYSADATCIISLRLKFYLVEYVTAMTIGISCESFVDAYLTDRHEFYFTIMINFSIYTTCFTCKSVDYK